MYTNVGVVEELLPVVTSERNGLMPKDGFLYRGEIKSGTDLDTIKLPGYYSLSVISDLVNCPVDYENIYGTLIVIKGYNEYSLQFLILHDWNDFYFRGEVSTGYKPWKKLSTVGGV